MAAGAGVAASGRDAGKAQEGREGRVVLAEITGTEAAKFRFRVDNKSAITLCKNPVDHEGSKHIDVRYHFIRECIKTK